MSYKPRVFQIGSGTLETERKALKEAAGILRSGGLVAFPTETVYGLGADATNPQAVERLNQVKGRPPEKPYSWHLASSDQIQTLVPSIPAKARRLMERLWPGPLTIVWPTAEGKTLGFRVPDHSVAQAFLRACGVLVVAPSANRAGASPAIDAATVLAAFDGDIHAVIDSGPTPLGRESTVVKVTGDGIEILREGAIASDRIFSLLAKEE